MSGLFKKIKGIVGRMGADMGRVVGQHGGAARNGREAVVYRGRAATKTKELTGKEPAKAKTLLGA